MIDQYRRYILHNIEENEKQYLLFFPVFYSLFKSFLQTHLFNAFVDDDAFSTVS